MDGRSIELEAHHIFALGGEGARIGSERDAVDLIGAAAGADADWVLIPVGRLEDAFFQLGTQRAGHFLQKLVTYGLRIAIVGDFARNLDVSDAFTAFVRESNRGGHVWFVADEAAFQAKLAASPSSRA